MDALSRILRSVRLESGIISRAHLSVPWAVSSPGAPSPIFHAVTRGSCWVRREGERTPTRLARGDVVVLARGEPHVLFDDPRTRPVSIKAIPTRAFGGVALIEHGGGGEETRIVCGKFVLEHESGSALLALLPPLLHIGAENGALTEWIETTISLLDHEVDRDDPGADAILGRIADVLFVQVLRRWLAGDTGSARGWLAAAQDPQIGQALTLIHEDPAARWSASTLAAKVGMSRSSFFERFTTLLGEPPARYVTRWRLHRATDLMAGRRWSTAQIAERVGYASEDAFTKVFKRHLGLSPSAYRRRLDGATGRA